MSLDISRDEIRQYLLSYKNVTESHPYGPEVAVYELRNSIFALVSEHKTPIKLSLRCDEQLSKVLQRKYESVLPGQNLDRKKWITIILSGQLTFDEIKAFIELSYKLAKTG